MTRRFLAFLRGAASFGGFVIALTLLVSGLSADSREATTGGFLYSDYLTRGDGGAATGELFGKAGSFDVQLRRTALDDGRDKILAAATDELRNIPLREWTLGYLLNDTDAADIAAAGRLRTAQGGWRLLEATAQAAVSAATEGAQERGFIRHIGLDVNSRLGRRLSSAGLNVLGALRETENDALAWQLRGFIAGTTRGTSSDETYGGNVGLIYRHAAIGGQLVGANVFTDYEHRDKVAFVRWSGGGEYRSPWVDIFGNYYATISDPELQSDRVIYTADGYDAALHLHSPRHRWLTGVAGYYFYSGQYGREDEDGLRVGLRFTPKEFPIILEVLYDNGKGEPWGGRFEVNHTFGEQNDNNGSAVAVVRPQDWFFAPVEREYTQRIFTVRLDTAAVASWSLQGVSPFGGVLGIDAADSTLTVTGLSTDSSASSFRVVGTENELTVSVVATVYPLASSSSLAVTITTGPLVGAATVSAVFSYKDGRTTVRVGSTVVFAANGAREFALHRGNAMVETEMPMRAEVLAAVSGKSLAVVSVMASTTIALSYNGNTLEIGTDGGGFVAVLNAGNNLTVRVSPDTVPIALRYDLGTDALIVSTGGGNVVIDPLPGDLPYSCERPPPPELSAVILCPSLFAVVMRENPAYDATMILGTPPASTVSLSQVNIANGIANISYSERLTAETLIPFAFLTVAGAGASFGFSIMGDTNALSLDRDTAALSLQDGVSDGVVIFTVRATNDLITLESPLTLSLSEIMLPNVTAALENPAGEAFSPISSFTGIEGVASTLARIVASSGVGFYAYTIQGAAELLRVDADGRIILVNAPTGTELNNNAEYKITVLVQDANAPGAPAAIDFAVGTDNYLLALTATLAGLVEVLNLSVQTSAPSLAVFGVGFETGAGFVSFRLPQGVAFTVQATGGITLPSPDYRYTVIGNDCGAVNTGENPVCPAASASPFPVIFTVNAAGEVSWDSGAAALVVSALDPSAAAVYTPTVRVIDRGGNVSDQGISVTVHRPLNAAFVSELDRTQLITLDAEGRYEWFAPLNNPAANVVIVALTAISDAADIAVTPDISNSSRLMWDDTNNELTFNGLSVADDGKLYTVTLVVSDTGTGAALTPDDFTLTLTVLVRASAPLEFNFDAQPPILYESDTNAVGSRLLPVGDDALRLAAQFGEGIVRTYQVVSESCTVMEGTTAANCGHTSPIFAVSTSVVVTMVGLSVINSAGMTVTDFDTDGVTPLSVAATLTGYVVTWADAEIQNVDEAEYVLEVRAQDFSGHSDPTVIGTDTAMVTITAYSIRQLQATITGPGDSTGAPVDGGGSPLGVSPLGSASSPLLLTINQEALVGSADVPFATVALSGGVGGGDLAWSCDAAALTKNSANNVSGINVMPTGCATQNSDIIVLSYPNGGNDLVAGNNTLLFTITDQRRSDFEANVPAFAVNNALNSCTPTAIADDTCEEQVLALAADLILTIYAEVRVGSFAEFTDTSVFNTRAGQNDSTAMMHADPDFSAATDDVRFVVYDERNDLADLIIGGANHDTAFGTSFATLVELAVEPSDLLTVGIGRQCDYGGGGCVDSLRFRSAEELETLTIPALMTFTVSLSGRAADSREFAPLEGVLTLVLARRGTGLDMGANVDGSGAANDPFIVTIDSTNLQRNIGTVNITAGSGVMLVSVHNFDQTDSALSLRSDIPRPVSILANDVFAYHGGTLTDPARTIVTVTNELGKVVGGLPVIITSTSTITINYPSEGRYSVEIAVSGGQNTRAALALPSGNFIHFQTRDISNDCASDHFYYQSVGRIFANDGIVKPGDLQIDQLTLPANAKVAPSSARLRALLHDDLIWMASPVLMTGSATGNTVQIGPCQRGTMNDSEFLVGPNFEVSVAGSDILLGADDFTISTSNSGLTGTGERTSPLLVTLDADFSAPSLLLGELQESPYINNREHRYQTIPGWSVASRYNCPSGCDFTFDDVSSPRAPGLHIVPVFGASSLSHFIYVSLVAPTGGRPESIALSTYVGVSGIGTAGDPLVVPFLRGAQAEEYLIARLSIATPQSGLKYRFVDARSDRLRAHSSQFVLISVAGGVSTNVFGGENGGLLRFVEGAITPGLSTISLTVRLVNEDDVDLSGTDLVTVMHVQADEYTQDDLQVVFLPHPDFTGGPLAPRLLGIYGTPADPDNVLAGSAAHPYVLRDNTTFGDFNDIRLDPFLLISVQIAGLSSAFSKSDNFISSGEASARIFGRVPGANDDAVGNLSFFVPSGITLDGLNGKVINLTTSDAASATTYTTACLRGDITTTNNRTTIVRRLHMVWTHEDGPGALAKVVSNPCAPAEELQILFQAANDLDASESSRLTVFGNPTDPALRGSRANPFIWQGTADNSGNFNIARLIDAIPQGVAADGTTTPIYDLVNIGGSVVVTISIPGGSGLLLRFPTSISNNGGFPLIGIGALNPVNFPANTILPCARIDFELANPAFPDLGQVSRPLFMMFAGSSTDVATLANACEGIELQGLSSSLPGDGSADTPLIFNTPRRITTIVNAADTDEYSENVTTIADVTIAAGEALATVEIIGDLTDLTISLAASSSPLLSINADTRVLSFASAVPVTGNAFYGARIFASSGGINITIPANVSLRTAGCNALYHQAEYLLIGHSLYNIFGGQSFVRLIDNGNQEVPITSLPSRPTQYPHGFRSRGFRAGDIIYKREGDFLTQRFGSNRDNPELAAARTEDRWTVFDIDDSDVDAGKRQYLARLVLDADGDSVNSCDRPLASGEFVAPDDYVFAPSDSAPLYSDLRGISVPLTITMPTPAELPRGVGDPTDFNKLATVVASVTFDGGVYPQYSVVVDSCHFIAGQGVEYCANLDSQLRITPQGKFIALPGLDASAARIELSLSVRDGAGASFSETIEVVFPGAAAESACLALSANQQPFVFPVLQGAITLYGETHSRQQERIARFPKYAEFDRDQPLLFVYNRPGDGDFNTNKYVWNGSGAGGVSIFPNTSRAARAGDFVARVLNNFGNRVQVGSGNPLNHSVLTLPLRDHRTTGIEHSDIGFLLYALNNSARGASQVADGELGVAITENPGAYGRIAPFVPRQSCSINVFRGFMINATDFRQIRDPGDYASALTDITP